MPQVESLADTLFGGVLLDDALLDGHALCHHLLQGSIVHIFEWETQQFGPVCHVADEAVLEHLGIAREDVPVVERVEKVCVKQYRTGTVEDTDLVLQSSEIDARLASHAGIHHAEQCGGNINVGDATLEGAGCKAAQVCDHAAAQIDHQAVPRGSPFLQSRPYMGECVECLMLVGGSYGDEPCSLHAGKMADRGPAKFAGGGVRQNEETVVRTSLDGLFQVGFQIVADDDFLCHGL